MTSRRRLAKRALLSSMIGRSSTQLRIRHEGPDDVPSMESFTREKLERVDPDGLRAVSLMNEQRYSDKLGHEIHRDIHSPETQARIKRINEHNR